MRHSYTNKRHVRTAMAGRPLPKQKGVALITVMMVVAISVIIISQMLEKQYQDIQRTSSMLILSQASAYSLAVEEVAVQGLIKDRIDDERKSALVDTCSEEWAKERSLPYEDIFISMSIQDLQGRFNINNLLIVDEDSGDYIRNKTAEAQLLIILKELGMDSGVAGALVDDLVEWLDADDMVDTGGHEDDGYEEYRTGNGPIVHLSELRMLKSLHDEYYDTSDSLKQNDANSAGGSASDEKKDILVEITPYLSALPLRSKVNINTAPKAVVLGLLYGLDSNAAGQILAERKKAAFKTVDDVLALPAFADAQKESAKEDDKQAIAGFKELIAVHSEYFQIVSMVDYAEKTSKLISHVNRVDQYEPVVYSRNRNVKFYAEETPCNPE